jgi:hypothetical protein
MQIEQDVEGELILSYIAEKFPGKGIGDLSLDALNTMYEDLFIPF